MPLLRSCRLALVASLALLTAAGKRVPAARPVTALGASLPKKHYLRVNDTLMLVVSRPYTTSTTPARATATWLWQRAELRGRRGYRQLLDDGSGEELSTLYGARSDARGTLVRLSFWRDPHHLPPRYPARLRLGENDESAFACVVWDVRYRTLTWFYDANLDELDSQSDENPFGFKNTAFGFTGGRYNDYYEQGVFYLLPHWIAAEQARVRRTHRLPAPARLAAYLGLAEASIAGAIQPPPYRLLLARLLRAYAACPMPAATARQVAQAQRTLTQVH